MSDESSSASVEGGVRERPRSVPEESEELGLLLAMFQLIFVSSMDC